MEQKQESLKLDFTLQDPAERNELVKRIIEQSPPENLTPKYLEILADYIIFAMDKEERKQKKILTKNRMVTVNKRETSFEGLVSKFENGEDGLYNMIICDKNVILTPKVEITQKDLKEIPGLKELRTAAQQVEEQAKKAKGRKKYLLKKQAIEMRKDQYIMKNCYNQPIYATNLIKSIHNIQLNERVWLDKNNVPHGEGFSFFFPEIVEAFLCNYSKLKEIAWDNFNCDAYYALIDLENLIEKYVKDEYPIYYDIIIQKIDGKTNEQIQKYLLEKEGTTHTSEYISSLWRKKIPKVIATGAQKEWLNWHYSFEEKGHWKRCGRCGQTKLVHNLFFSKNRGSRDGFYSICKDCRNKKYKKMKGK